MLRDNWEFEFSAKKLADAALAKQGHHEGRLRFWQSAKEKVMAEVRESGIEVSEPIGDHSNTSRGRSPQVMVRNDLQAKLNECHGKILEHMEHVREYAGWVNVLQGNPENHLKLNADDYLFFFGT